ncbi:MAG: ArsR/SmtB family transcription factor [Acidimicrobiales bacterium]
MAHPLRLRILRICLYEALTNKQMADRLGADPATTLHHVRLLVSTGFLAEEAVRTGARGALEKPYRATGKSWILSVSRPEDQTVGQLAVVDALRAEQQAAAPDDVLARARLAVRLSAQGAVELRDRIMRLVKDVKATDDGPAADAYGLDVVLHRQR